MIHPSESLSQQIHDRTKSISIRLVLLTTILSSLISGSALIYFFAKRTEVTVSNVRVTIQQSIALGDIYQLRKQADSLIAGGTVSGVWITDHDGNLLASKQVDGSAWDPLHADRASFLFKGGTIFTSSRSKVMTAGGKHLGTIIVMAPFPLDQFVLSQLFLLGLLLLGSRYLLYSFRSFGAYISRPLLDFCEQISSVSLYNRRVELQKPYREIALLETEFNGLLARAMESEGKEREAEKQAAIGRLISQLSHDMRAPLHTIERLLYLPDATPIETQRSAISESLRRLHAMIESLRHTDLELLIKRRAADVRFPEIFAGLQTVAQERNRLLHIQGAPASLPLQVDLLKFERALLNIASNALDFAHSAVWIEVDTQPHRLKVRITDDGPGVADVILPRLFQRGATHGKHDGTGLGLAYARQILRGHGGDVVYRREADRTVFECSLPQTRLMEEPLPPSSTATEKVKRVALVFESPALNQRVHEKLIAIAQDSYAFSLDLDESSAIALTDSEEKAELAANRGIRPILLTAMSEDEIVRRAPIRLGIRG